MHVTMSDIERLARNPSPGARADIAAKVASTLSAGAFSDRESGLAVEILRVLVRDVEVQVRKAVAHNLRDCLTVPHEIVMALAQDETEVAVPLLRYSYVLSEDDLIAIVQSTCEVAKLVAVASRESISADLSEALMDTEVHEALKTLFSNRGAVVRDNGLMARWDNIARHQALLETLVRRGGLSVAVAEKLYAAVSDEMREGLSAMYKLPVVLAHEALEDSREWATLGLTRPDEESDEISEAEIEKLVMQLDDHGRLTHSLIIRSLCVGDIRFFEAAMARLAAVPRINARLLMFDQGALGFQAFYGQAKMPSGFYESIHTLLRLALEETGYGRFRREDFKKRVLARIQSEQLDKTVENMPYLLTIIGGKLGTSETLH